MSDIPLHRDLDESLPVSPVGHTHAQSTHTAVVVTARDGTEECTIFPLDVTDEALVTTWVSASEGSFVPLAAMR